MVTPFSVTFRWLEAYLNALKESVDDTAARVYADRAVALAGKSFARCQLRGITLTIPVEGGAAVLKRRDASPLLSGHGKWRREHIGAFNAIYGRTPYFEHLMPQIRKVYDESQGISLEQFNSKLLQVALHWLDIGACIEIKPHLQDVVKETKARIDDNLSIFDAIFRLGKQTGWIFVSSTY